MKTTTIKILSALVLFLGLNKTLSAQCSINASFTYTTTDSSISATSTSTGISSNTDYYWNLSNTTYTSYGSSTIFSSLYNGTYTVTLNVFDSTGTCYDSSSQLITVSGGINPPPCVASFTYAIGSAGFVTFTNTSPVDTFNNTSYSWSTGTDTITFLYNDTYVVTLNASNTLDNCSISSTQTITITNAAPSPCTGLSANYTYTLGANGEVSFASTSTGTNTTSTYYTWNFGDGTIYGYYNQNADTVYTYTSNGVYNVSLTVTKTLDSLSYPYGPCVDSISIPITINNSCNANFTYTLGANAQVSFTNAAGGLSYSWAFGDPLGSSSTLPNPIFNYVYNGTYNVIFQIVDSSGYNCSTSQVITIINGLTPPVCNSSFSYTIGTNAQVSFTSLGSGLSYYWSFGNAIGSSDTIPNPTFNYVYNGTYYVTLQLQDSVGFYCDSTQVITITNGSPLPTCDSAFTYTLGADGEVSFTNTSGGLSYNWSFGDPIFSTSTLPNPTFTYVSNGTYTVTFQIQDSAGYYCNSSQVITIVNTNSCTPVVSYSLYQDTMPHTWDVYPFYSSQVSSAIWNWGDGTSTTGLYPTHIYSSPNWYNICVTVFSACGDSTVYCQNDTLYRLGHNSTLSTMVYVNVIFNPTGISQISDISSTISIYPNPNNGNFVIETNNITTKTLQVYDVNGKLVLSQTVTDKTSIDASSLNEGVYNISLQSSNDGVVNKRLVIVR